jgi:hypothetical protein
MYDADIQSTDAAAKGARSWMAPQVSTGLFMTPYKYKDMGSYMIGVTQMIPNASRLKADSDYMNATSVEVENKIILLIN